jgi:hypothetical protein
MNSLLQARGLRTWFDEEAMHGNIQEQMRQGILNTAGAVVFVTDAYLEKVAGKGPLQRTTG